MITSDALKAINVLMIDDDEDDFLIAREVFDEIERVAYKIDWKNNYEEGMLALLKEPYDVCLLDYRLGAKTGLEFLEELKQYDCSTPIIMLTGQNSRDIDLLAMKTGATDYLIKDQASSVLFERSVRYAIDHAQKVDAIKARERIIEHRTRQLQQANEDLKRLATRDGLTGIANRRCFDDTLAHEWARASREGEFLSLIMVDIDFFKNYNDSFGHLKGDECLKRVCQEMRAHIRRKTDLLARFGGEEFAILLTATDSGGASQFAENIVHSVEKLRIKAAKTNVSQWVTISAGVATCLPAQESLPQQLIDQADQALYKAKQGGRNRVISVDIKRPSKVE